MTREEALKLALEVLRRIDEVAPTAMAKLVMPEIEQALKQPEQEPVGWAEHGVINWLADKQFNHTSFLYDTPAQRTWVGLTYEDMTKLQKDLYDAKGESVLPTTFAMAVEAKLKEKNI
jgi:hypothetical protein